MGCHLRVLSLLLAVGSLCGVSREVVAQPSYQVHRSLTFGRAALSTYARGGAYDTKRNLYVAGGSHTSNIEAVCPRVFHFGPRGGSDSFVMKFNQRGALKWCLIIGGSGYDRLYGIDVRTMPAANGRPAYNYILVHGRAGPQMPTTVSAVAPEFSGGVGPGASGYGAQDGYVATFIDRDIADTNPALSPQFLAGTYLGGNNPQNTDNTPTRGARILSLNGVLHVAAFTGTLGNPVILPAGLQAITTNGTHDSVGSGTEDVLVTLLRLDTLAGVWATFVGGSGNESSSGSIAILPPDSRHPRERPVVLTATTSNDIAFPQVTAPLQAVRRGVSDLLIAVLDPMTGQVTNATLLGRGNAEFVETHNVTTAKERFSGEGSRIIVAAQTLSNDFQFTPTPWQNGHGGNGGAANYQGDC
ncbi:MAG: hypothetical protein RL417_1440, partial [Pseudomonadota bacterium]